MRVSMDESSMIANRRSRRSPVLLAASIEVDGASIAVKLRNLSEEGALIEADDLPKEGSSACFVRNDLRIKGRVVWVHGRYAGIAFDRPLNPDQVLRNIGKPRPKPAVEQDFRRPGLACRPLTDYERTMLERWMTASPVGKLGD
jgi:PilZ domain